MQNYYFFVTYLHKEASFCDKDITICRFFHCDDVELNNVTKWKEDETLVSREVAFIC